MMRFFALLSHNCSVFFFNFLFFFLSFSLFLSSQTLIGIQIVCFQQVSRDFSLRTFSISFKVTLQLGESWVGFYHLGTGSECLEQEKRNLGENYLNGGIIGPGNIKHFSWHNY